MNTRPDSIPAAGPAPAPMQVSYFDGLVTIAVPPALARDIASVWGHAHAVDPLLAETRPDWYLDVTALIANSLHAQMQTASPAEVVDVPVLTLPTTDPTRLKAVPS